MITLDQASVRPEIRRIIEELKPVFEKDAAIESVKLFGSQVRGEAVITSDVDIAIIAEYPQNVDRGSLRVAVDSWDMECDFVYTTPNAVLDATRETDVNYWINKEGVTIWQR